ncbi:MAG: hypothetical protein A2V79_11645 [Betaproteobacteria bacterium RBG_16_56_24]|nr:MAG: hypothetical protein A2V79_11645 [Betaproteobacteria bacterium RBG_16_56_24]
MKGMHDCLIHPSGRAEWTQSMRASLVRILAQQAKARELQEQEAALLAKCSAQLTFSDLDSSFSKTLPESEPGAGMWLSGNWWRVDTLGATESLGRLMSEPIISEIDGFVLLPTLTVCGNYNRKGASATSGDGLITLIKRGLFPTMSASDTSCRKPPKNFHITKTGSVKHIGKDGTYSQIRLSQFLQMLPTLCARDARTVAGSQPPKRKETSGDPLTWYLGKNLEREQRRGLKLSVTWSAWFMGWPINWFRER